MKNYNKALDLVQENYDELADYLEQWRSDESITDEGGTEYLKDFDLLLDVGSNEALLYNVLFIVGAGATEDGHDKMSRVMNRIAKLVSFKDEMKLHKAITKHYINLDDYVEFESGELYFAMK